MEDKHPEYKTWKDLYIQRYLLLRKLKKITLADLDQASRFLTISEDLLSIHHVNPPDATGDVNWVCQSISFVCN